MNYQTKNIPQSGFIRLSTVLEIIPISKSSWWQGVKDGIYPQPVKIGQRVTAWRSEDISALVDELSRGEQPKKS